MGRKLALILFFFTIGRWSVLSTTFVIFCPFCETYFCAPHLFAVTTFHTFALSFCQSPFNNFFIFFSCFRLLALLSLLFLRFCQFILFYFHSQRVDEINPRIENIHQQNYFFFEDRLFSRGAQQYPSKSENELKLALKIIMLYAFTNTTTKSSTTTQGRWTTTNNGEPEAEWRIFWVSRNISASASGLLLMWAMR